MMMTYFLSIVARCLALTDKILDAFVGPAQLINLANADCPAYIISVNTTECGDLLATQIQSLIFSGVGLLNGLLAALGATSSAGLLTLP